MGIVNIFEIRKKIDDQILNLSILDLISIVDADS